MADDAVTTPQDDTGAAADTSILTEAPEAPKPEGDTPPSDEPKATDTDPKEGEKPADKRDCFQRHPAYSHGLGDFSSAI